MQSQLRRKVVTTFTERERQMLLTKFCAASNSSILFWGGTLTVGAVAIGLSPPPVAAPLLANEGSP